MTLNDNSYINYHKKRMSEMMCLAQWLLGPGSVLEEYAVKIQTAQLLYFICKYKKLHIHTVTSFVSKKNRVFNVLTKGLHYVHWKINYLLINYFFFFFGMLT